MATEACRDWRGDLGLEALGALDEPARTALLAHLDGCAACRAVLADLSVVGAALADADLERVDIGEAAAPPRELADRVLERLQWERVARRRRRTRTLIGSIAGIAAAAVIAVVLVLGHGGSGDHGRVVALSSPQRGVHAEAVLSPTDGGTRVRLQVDGLDDGEWYWLWLTGADGKRVSAGTFTGGHDGQQMTLTSALSFALTRRVWVTDDQNRVVLDSSLATT